MKKLMVIEYLKTIIINIKLYASGYAHVNFGVYVIIHPKNSCRMIDLRIDCYTIYLVIYLFEMNNTLYHYFNLPEMTNCMSLIC